MLVAVGAGKSERHCLMDVKEAIAAAAPRAPDADMPRDNAERVVAGARALSPALGGRMRAARLLGSGVFVRELLPEDLKLELEVLTRGEATEMAGYLAGVVGRAHAGQMNDAQRRGLVEAALQVQPSREDPGCARMVVECVWSSWCHCMRRRICSIAGAMPWLRRLEQGRQQGLLF